MQDAKLLHTCTLVCTSVEEHPPQMKRTHEHIFSFSAHAFACAKFCTLITWKKLGLGCAEHNKLNCEPREEFLLAAVLKADNSCSIDDAEVFVFWSLGKKVEYALVCFAF